MEKKLKEELSRALSGREIRNRTADKIIPFLWLSDVDGAIAELKNIPYRYIKNPEIISKFIDYLERVREFIPCYAMQKKLGLRNSSNLGEKSNDLVISSRQKYKGMSWSSDGTSALASVSSLLPTASF